MKRHLIHILAVSSLLSAPLGLAHAASTTSLKKTVASSSTEAPINFTQLTQNLTHNTNLSPKAVEMALAGYRWALAHSQVKNKDILTIVDFSLSSATDRLYVVNLKTGEILLKTPVAHGKNSGQHQAFATHFSNVGNSRCPVLAFI